MIDGQVFSSNRLFMFLYFPVKSQLFNILFSFLSSPLWKNGTMNPIFCMAHLTSLKTEDLFPLGNVNY